MLGVEEKYYLLLLFVPVILNILMYLWRKKFFYLSTLDIVGEKTSKDTFFRKIEKILFYSIYVTATIFLAEPYLVKLKKPENVIIVIDNSYSTSVKYENSDRFSLLIEKAKKITRELNIDKVYYFNYDYKKNSLTDNPGVSKNVLNYSLLKHFIQANIKIGNVVILFTDATRNKKKVIDYFKDNENFYYYIVGQSVRNYCISKISHITKPFRERKITLFVESYNQELPPFIIINGRRKKIQTNSISFRLPFHIKFLKAVLPDGDDCYVDNQISLILYNVNFKIKHKFEKRMSSILTGIEKLFLSKRTDTILITDAPISGKFYKVIYTGFTHTQQVRNMSFQKIIFFDPQLFYNINNISFLRNENIPHFVFLEGRPLFATNRGYLILEERGNIFTSFKIDENITTNKFWHIFVWKRIIEYAIGTKNPVKSSIAIYPECDLSSSQMKNKEFNILSTQYKYYPHSFIKTLLVSLLIIYILVIFILIFL
ncbi:MAG: hypothetical protein ACK4NF_00200 [Planctomycetota bacterium]